MAILAGKDPNDETDITEQPTEPIPIQTADLDDVGACVLCMLSYESQFGRPVDGEDYSSDHLEICQHHIRLLMMAHDDELDLMRATVEMAYARYRPPYS